MSTKFEELLIGMRNRQHACAEEARRLEENAKNLRIEESTLRQWSNALEDKIKEPALRGAPCQPSS